MQLTQHYYSAAVNNFNRPKSKDFVSPFAQATFDAFEPFINVFDPGASFLGPYHSITKEDWAFYHRHKPGEKPLFYDDGTKFHPFNHVIRNIYSPEHVQKHIVDNETSYYTSGRNGLGLFYLDVDAHKPWQTDDFQGKVLLQNLFPFGYFRTSTRGQNGYLKVSYSSIEEFNEFAPKLDASLKRLFLHSEILSDIEIKGTITHEGKSGLLAMLPFTTKFDQHKRDETDSWDGRQLELFKSCPIVNVRRLEEIIRQIESQIDEDKVARFLEKKRKIEEWSVSRAEIVKHYRNREFRGTDQEVFAQAKELRDRHLQSLKLNGPTMSTGVVTSPLVENIAPNPSSDLGPSINSEKMGATLPKRQTQNESTFEMRKVSWDAVGTATEADAFDRNLRDLLPFVRDFYKKYRAFPTVEAVLTHLRENGLFSGKWSDNEERRANRVAQVLNFVIKTFDPKLLRTGTTESISLYVGKFGWWVRNHIGTELFADVINLQCFDPVTLTVPAKRVSVPARFIETFLNNLA
jgi:hypothetical protein